jgi:uncharacterized lipoprotein YmbA
MKQIYLVASLIFLSSVIISCGSTLPTHYYRIDTDPDMNKVDQVITLKVEVNSVRAPERYRDRIVYREGEYEYGFYEYSRWIDTPGEMIRRSLINALSKSGLFSLVDPFGNDSDSDLDLNSEIVSFDQVVEGEVNFADFGLILEFSHSDTGSPVWSYRTKERIEQQGEESFAAAMSEAVKEAITRAIVEMGKSKKLRGLPAELNNTKKDTGISGN